MQIPTALTLFAPATGFEARGFIWGAPLALALQCSFVPLRKPGKLPGKLHPLYCHCHYLTLCCQAVALYRLTSTSERTAWKCM